MKKIAIVIVVISVLTMSIAGIFVYGLVVMKRPLPDNAKTRSVIIGKGDNFRTISTKLVEANVISHSFIFKLYAFFDGGYRHVKSGYYEFAPGTTPARAFQMLIHGETARIRLTIPEGFNIYRIARLLEQLGICKRTDFINLASEYDIIDRYRLPGPTLEGYIFPDTYFFPKNVKLEKVIDVLVRRFLDVWNTKVKPLAKSSGMSRREIITLASMVEKETGDKEEKPLIASVFLNRLRARMRLQSDPTTIYGIERQTGDFFSGKLTKDMLHAYTPYNTYTIPALPPGPIANPGLDSIMAVLEPEHTDYYYFVSRNDGSHKFNRDLVDHNGDVYRYQKSR